MFCPIPNFNNAGIEAAIKAAELRTSGEICVCIERRHYADIEFRAKEVFSKLNVANTPERNGVLLYVHLRKKKLVVLGDSGINSKVEDNFWTLVCNGVTECYSRNEMTVGTMLGIMLVGEKLAALYPQKPGEPKNLLPDAVAIGENI